MFSGQPVISRETRRLLITVAVSVAAMWVLARIRFQERASGPVVAQAFLPVVGTVRPHVFHRLESLCHVRAVRFPAISTLVRPSYFSCFPCTTDYNPQRKRLYPPLPARSTSVSIDYITPARNRS